MVTSGIEMWVGEALVDHYRRRVLRSKHDRAEAADQRPP